MFLKDIQFLDESDKTKIYTEAICITEMFLWYLGKKFKTEDCNAIFFYCGKFEDVRIINEEHEGYDVLVPKNSYDVELPFDLLKYNQETDFGKKKMLTLALQKGMTYLAKSKGWDIKKVNQSIERMFEKKLTHTFQAWKGKLSPDKRKLAYPLVHLDLNEFKVSLIVEDRRKQIIATKDIVVTKPDVDELAYYMKTLEWLSDSEVVLYTRAHKKTSNGILL